MNKVASVLNIMKRMRLTWWQRRNMSRFHLKYFLDGDLCMECTYNIFSWIAPDIETYCSGSSLVCMATQTVQLTMPTLSPSITIAHNETSVNPPYQIKSKSKRLGRHLSGSKVSISFQFGFIVNCNTVANYGNEEHEVILIWSHFTGKRQLIMDGKKIHMTKSPRPVSLSRAVSGRFEYWWIIPGNHILKIITNGILPIPPHRSKRFDLELDGVSYYDLRTMKSDQPEVTAPFSNLKDDEVEHLQLDEILDEFVNQLSTIPSMIGCTLASTSFESSYCDSTAPSSNLTEKSCKIIETLAPTVASIPIEETKEEASLVERMTSASTAASIPIVKTEEEVSLIESMYKIATKDEQSWFPFFRCPMTESISSSPSSASLLSPSLSSESYSSVSASTSGKTDSFTVLTTPDNQTFSFTTFTFEEPKSTHSTQASTSLAGWLLTITRQLKTVDRLVDEKKHIITKQNQPRVIVVQPRSEGVDLVHIQ